MEKALSAERIAALLDGEQAAVRAENTVTSTNLILKDAVKAGKIGGEPVLLAADCQTAGRGRLGRSFVSPPGTGLYMSLYAPMPPGADPGRITILSAVAVCRAIEEMTGESPKIKWVNDLFLRGRKICGILAEGVQTGVIIGIGVNVLPPPGGFPQEAGIAGAIGRELDRSELAGRIGRHLLKGLKCLNDPGIIAAYRARMPLIGREISYINRGKEKHARVLGVAEDGGLQVLCEDGKETLRSGEVTLGSQAFSGLE